MKAIVQSGYGVPEHVLSLEQMPVPSAAADELLIRVRAASVHADVWHVVTGRPYVLRLMGAGLRRPRIRVPGTDLAGVIESVGASVTQFKPGDEVFGECIKGYQWVNGGAYAEYAVARADWMAPKPGNVTFEQAASVPASGIIALSGLRREGRLRAGQKVLINGAGGGVGLLAIQIARAHDAEVTGVDDAVRQEVMRSVGAHHTIDYRKQDFTQGGERYDLIVDMPGNHSFSRVKRVLGPEGVYVFIGHDGYGRTRRRWLGSIPRALGLMARAPFNRHLPKSGFSTPDKKESMATLHALVESGKITPVVGKTFQLSEAALAIRYLADGQAVGKVVLTV